MVKYRYLISMSPQHFELSKFTISRVLNPKYWDVSNIYYCNVLGETVTEAEMGDPSYEPCVSVKILLGPRGKMSESGLVAFYVFNLVTNKIYNTGPRHLRVPVPVRKTKALIRKLYQFGFDLFKSIGDFANFALPIVRRSFPSVMSTQIVSVQPMSLPGSSIFYIKHTYGSPNRILKPATAVAANSKGVPWINY